MMMDEPLKEGPLDDVPTGEDRWHQYRRTSVVELRPYERGEDMTEIEIFAQDAAAGHPKEGDYIARDPTNPEDQWLMSEMHARINFRRI